MAGPALSLAVLISVQPAMPAAAAAPAPSGENARIVHVLNRLAYGPRPGDVEAVRALGVEAWIERQLHPERIDDRKVEERIAALETASLSASELLAGYEVPREARREIQKRRGEMGEEPSEDEMRQARRELMRKYAGDRKGSPRQVVDELQQAKVLRATRCLLYTSPSPRD